VTIPKWMELVFGVKVATKDSCFILYGDSDLLTERETFPEKK